MEKKYVIDTQENRAWLSELAEELLQFGHGFASPGGGSYYLGDDGSPWKDRPRETWITCRMAHVYSIGAMMGHQESGELVDAALKGLTGELCDKTNGGWYAGVAADGSKLPYKQCYAHAFVILAATSALLAGRDGAKELLDRALSTFDQYFWLEDEGLVCDTWDTDFKVLDDYRGINANMHTVEAFLAVYDATGNVTYRERAGRIINHVTGWAKENQYRIPEHFTKDWVADLECNKDKPDDPFKPYGATPGHGIEWARLITQWAVATYGKEGAAEYLEIAEKLFNRAIDDGWNADGAKGIVYTTDWEGKPVVHDRMHWTLAEAINTSAVLYHMTGKEQYAKHYAEFLTYLDETVHDSVNGSWFHQLNEKNELLGTVWPGKSDIYHALQSMLIPYGDVSVSIAKTIYGRRPINPCATENARKLLSNLYQVAGNGIITGQHTQTVPMEEITYIREQTGQEPMLRGFELLGYSPNINYEESGEACLTEVEENKNTIEEAYKWGKERKGIVTFSFHWFSPLGGSDKSFYAEHTDFDPSKVLLMDSPEREAFFSDLDVIANLLKPFCEADIPILWRPFHESDGEWFWWGRKGPGVAKELYKLMYHHFVEVHQLDNLLWVWNCRLREGYPGDEYVDVTSVDIYLPEYKPTDYKAEYEELVNGTTKNKVAALGEIGYLPDIEMLAKSKIPFAYYMSWSKEFIIGEQYNSKKNLQRLYANDYALKL